ncbi:hypothetical protein KAJ27_25925 [bacterium]|nr:hypothetical protein [bacterium]
MLKRIFNKGNRRGMAIPIALFVILIGTIIMFSLSFHVESNSVDTRKTYYKKQAECLAESGINLLFLKMVEMKLGLDEIASDRKKMFRFIKELNSNNTKISSRGFYKVDEFDIIQHSEGKIVIKVKATGKINKISKTISKILKIRMQ